MGGGGVMSRLLKKIFKTARENRGSTIVGVLAALTFITVVTSMMVKNTGSQAAASIGYGTAMAMHSTLNSGIFATEAAFSNTADMTEVLKKVHNNEPQTVIGGSKMMRLGSTDQYFRSELTRITADTRGETQLATCKISSGAKAGGRSLRTARVFFAVENLTYNAPSTTPPTTTKTTTNCRETKNPCSPTSTTYTVADTSVSTKTTTSSNNTGGGSGGNNAVYMAGKLQDGNNGMDVTGGATFEEEVRFQNKKAVFRGEAFFQWKR